MSLKKLVYSVLIVSAAEGFNNAISALLPESKYSPVHFVSNISAAKRALAEYAFDYVIINSPLPDDVGTRFAIDMGNSKETVVLLIVRAELQAEIYDKVAEHGVFVLSSRHQKHLWLLLYAGFPVQGKSLEKPKRKHFPLRKRWRKSV